MGITLGSNNCRFYVGTDTVNKIFLGNNLIYRYYTPELVFTYSSTDDCYLVGTGNTSLDDIKNDTSGSSGVDGSALNNSWLGGNVIIPETYNDGTHGEKQVKGIVANGFFGIGNITSFTIPYTLQVIGAYALGNSSNSPSSTLTAIVFENNGGMTNLNFIGTYAFQGNTGLTNITIPDSVNFIGSGILWWCNSLQSITLPFIGATGSETSPGANNLFGYCFGSNSFTGSTAVTQRYSSNNTVTRYIPSTLRNVTITGGNMLYGALSGLTMITTITIGSSVDIRDYAICRGCNNSSLVVNIYPTSVTQKITSSTTSRLWFYQCNSGCVLHIPNSVTTPSSNYGTYWNYRSSSATLTYYADLIADAV